MPASLSASAAQRKTTNPDRGLSLNFLLGTDYERRKEKLQQERQLEYKLYVSKKRDLKAKESQLQPQGLSLPIDQKLSVKEKLREERNKEYNLFLQEQARIRKLKRGSPPVTSKPGQVQASDAVNVFSQASPLSFLNSHTNKRPPHKRYPVSRRDAATLTEEVDNGKSTGTWGPGHWQRKRWQLYRPKDSCSSEEELNTDREEEFDFRYRRKQDRHAEEPEFKEERRAREHRVNRTSQDIKEVEDPGVRDQNNNESIWKSDLQMPDSTRMAARFTPGTSKDKAEFATGLMIGATEEQAVAQMRKEQYKQELLRQIAEQQRNKMKEKRLELRVAATGETDPEKEPDRIKQFAAVNRHHDSLRRDAPHQAVGKDPNPRSNDDNPTENTVQRASPGKTQVDYSHSTALSQLPGATAPGSGMGAARGVPSLEYFSEDYHRDFSNTLGEVAFSRVAGVAPPRPPIVPHFYKTPYDAAYYYYGTRNPLDHNPPYNQNGPHEGVQQSGSFEIPSQRPPPLRSRGRIEAPHQHGASPLAVEELHVEKSKQKRENALTYQEALRQQIKERAERKRTEKEQQERYDAKIEAEMMAYNPWGRSGGGAPIKDQKGNLVSDLNQMHKINESYRNPVFAPRGEARTPFSHRLSGSSVQPPEQQHHMQDRYKEALKQQIEEKKRKQAEERERIRMEEEKEEKRLVKERAYIQQKYEDEQMKQCDHRRKTQNFIHEPKTHQQEEEKRGRPEKEIQRVPQSTRPREEKNTRLNYEREPSPPVPALQKTNPAASRPSSVVSQLSSSTEHSASAPHNQPIPATTPQLQGDLNQMHRINKESYKNAVFAPRGEARAPFSHRLSGSSVQPPEQQHHMQDRYKEALKQQIEEKKRKQAEERERIRMEEEKEEKRLVKERAYIQQKYEDEQMKQCDREPSPPVPALQKTNPAASRPSSVVSQLSSSTEHSASAPHNQPIPATTPQLQDGQQKVIRELSALRRYLRKEQRQLEVELGQTGPQETHNTPPSRRRPRVDAFESAPKEAVRPSAWGLSPAAVRVNKQNIREFNQLKYRDTASREEVRAMYPDSPTDAQSLDIQQQALLREQQRKLRLMNRQDDHDSLDYQLGHYYPRKKPGLFIHRDSILPSETAFIDFYSGDACEEWVRQQRSPQPSAECQKRTAPRRRCDSVADSVDWRECDKQRENQSPQSATSLKLKSKVGAYNHRCIMRQDSGSGDHNSSTEVLSGDKVDVSSLCSGLGRRVSVETVATEPWLRPGTSAAGRHFEERPNSRIDAPPWLTHHVM